MFICCEAERIQMLSVEDAFVLYCIVMLIVFWMMESCFEEADPRLFNTFMIDQQFQASPDNLSPTPRKRN